MKHRVLVTVVGLLGAGIMRALDQIGAEAQQATEEEIAKARGEAVHLEALKPQAEVIRQERPKHAYQQFQKRAQQHAPRRPMFKGGRTR